MQENKTSYTGVAPDEVHADGPMSSIGTRSKWNPSGWQKKWKITAVIVAAIVIIVVIVGAVEGTKNSHHKKSYPDYSPLNYTLNERWEGTNFFDNFDYHSTADPADGFVKYVHHDLQIELVG